MHGEWVWMVSGCGSNGLIISKSDIIAHLTGEGLENPKKYRYFLAKKIKAKIGQIGQLKSKNWKLS